MLARQYPELEKPVYCVKKMSLLEKWRDYQFHKNLWKTDVRMRELYVREKGHTEGLEAVAQNALTKGMPVELISDITGLEIEKIEKIRDR